ncbi:HAD-IB family hydrolase [Microcoleus sp. B7-D4]|uniref:HAD-IB family hydrolase n=1 Tax=Microcoleus sp. B7-D4 TaxID=2818696 RepID=UPI002FD2019F
MSLTAAFFDVDGTLVKSTVVDYYLYLATQGVSPLQRWWTTVQLASKVPYYLLLDSLSRDYFNQMFYRNYRGISVEHCQRWSQIHFKEMIYPRLFPAALDCIDLHREQERQIVLVTGSLDFIIAPLSEFLDAKALTACLQAVNDKYTGKLVGVPLIGKEKGRAMQEFALEQGIDLTQSYAYGDSAADLPMLQMVGYPVAVNPDSTLYRFAKKNKWEVQYWKT